MNQYSSCDILRETCTCMWTFLIKVDEHNSMLALYFHKTEIPPHSVIIGV